MYYQIFVSVDDILLFSTAPDLIKKEKDYQKVMAVFNEKFPKEEGYEIAAAQWDSVCKILDVV